MTTATPEADTIEAVLTVDAKFLELVFGDVPSCEWGMPPSCKKEATAVAIGLCDARCRMLLCEEHLHRMKARITRLVALGAIFWCDRCEQIPVPVPYVEYHPI